MQAAFSGIKVLDVSRLLPGPFCSMLLADFGADVIKIEDPGAGDYIRWWPPLLGENSGFHVVLNRNKRSLTLNLKKNEAKEIFKQLVAGSDVVLEGFRPCVMDRLGLGYEVLRRINPKLIYCSITGYGADAPRAQRAGHDISTACCRTVGVQTTQRCRVSKLLIWAVVPCTPLLVLPPHFLLENALAWGRVLISP